MNSIVRKSWPKRISKELNYRLGEKPLHEYIIQNALDKPDQPSYVFYENEITWKELNDQTKQFAQFLKNQGIVKGSRVALFMQNCPQYVLVIMQYKCLVQLSFRSILCIKNRNWSIL